MAEHGHGTTLKIGSDTIGEIQSVSVAGQARDSIDTSSMDSTDKFREFIPGMIDAGEVTFEVTYDGAASGEASVLQTKLEAAAEIVLVEFADKTTSVNSSFSCSGFVSNLGIASDFEGKISQPVTIKLTGKPTFTTHD